MSVKRVSTLNSCSKRGLPKVYRKLHAAEAGASSA
jgi:hypothetical protein